MTKTEKFIIEYLENLEKRIQALEMFLKGKFESFEKDKK